MKVAIFSILISFFSLSSFAAVGSVNINADCGSVQSFVNEFNAHSQIITQLEVLSCKDIGSGPMPFTARASAVVKFGELNKCADRFFTIIDFSSASSNFTATSQSGINLLASVGMQRVELIKNGKRNYVVLVPRCLFVTPELSK